MQYTDVEAVINLHQEIFTPDVQESATVLKNRIEIFGKDFFVAIKDTELLGYVMCFPWGDKSTPVNNEIFPAALPRGECFYIHDIVVSPMARGFGVSKKLLKEVERKASEKGLSKMTLVSVEQSGEFWDKNGYQEVLLTQEEKFSLLSSYGNNARFMQKLI